MERKKEIKKEITNKRKQKNEDTDKSRKPNKLSKYLKAPIKILILARDFYMNGMSEISDHVGNGAVVGLGCPTTQVINTSSRSFSVSSYTSKGLDEDYRELLRTTSPKTSINLNKKSEYLDQLRRQQSQKDGGVGKSCSSNSNNKMPRSRSVRIGRIDEDSPYELQNDQVKNHALPRSRIYANLRRLFSRVYSSQAEI